MLKRSFRLAKKDMDRIYKKGQKAAQDLFVVRYLPNRSSHARFSVIISKKVLAKAVDRNQAKRKIYNLISSQEANWNNKFFDIALTLKRYDETNLASSLLQTLERVR